MCEGRVTSEKGTATIIFSVMKGFLFERLLKFNPSLRLFAYNILTLFNFSLFVGLCSFWQWFMILLQISKKKNLRAYFCIRGKVHHMKILLDLLIL